MNFLHFFVSFFVHFYLSAPNLTFYLLFLPPVTFKMSPRVCLRRHLAGGGGNSSSAGWGCRGDGRRTVVVHGRQSTEMKKSGVEWSDGQRGEGRGEEGEEDDSSRKLYEAYNELHRLAQEFETPFDASGSAGGRPPD